ncbi:Aste57867_13967 [Aphanomyces stellatus]|uniref:Aste57867_13967 protein n=1 Tax=Aphanomyces stellatus TaxID=120398 RepID=A0A485KZI7_9STRA|nr:hypothetical protein As57867_013916 [Aphanomyces stellatus]VFT90797.1 Aste57867_13967 [Aphanomyces stellatus]
MHRGKKNHHRRPKRHRDAAPPSTDFLAALEAQRMKQSEVHVPPNQADMSTPKAIPGFYFDPVKKKYFPGTAPAAPPSPPTNASVERPKARPWVRHLHQRELLGRRDQDRLDLIQLRRQPRSLRVASSIAYPISHHAVQMDYAPSADGRLALACASGSMFVFRKTSSSVLNPLAHAESSTFPHVSRVRWQPLSSSLISVTALGGANTTGFLQFLDPSSLALRHALRTPDAWHHTWCVVSLAMLPSSSFLSIHQEPLHAVTVDVTHGAKLVHGPATTSDVFAQAFCHGGTCILNGTRSGHVWLWDVRAKRVAFHERMATAASISDLHVLSNNASFLCATSAGAVCQLDLRLHRASAPLVAYVSPTMPPVPGSIPPRLAVDALETTVAASSMSLVRLWRVADGALLGSIDDGAGSLVHSLGWMPDEQTTDDDGGALWLGGAARLATC